MAGPTLQALKIYWKSLFMVLFPIALLPIFLTNNIAEMRCLYVVCLMAGFWVLEILPSGVTGLFPIIFFPIMGILDTRTTTMSYFKESNMMFIGGLIIALAIEYCNLHTRISLRAIKMIGCSYRRLHFGLVTLTMLVSMWISNTAATAMMLPIIQAVLEELEAQGLGKMYEGEVDEEGQFDESTKRPTRVTMCFYIGTAYAATIGGLGCIVGSGTNLVLKGIYETEFPKSNGVEFNKWLAANVPLMLAIMYPTWIWMQFWFMGLWRPNSEDAKAIDVGKEGEKITRQVLTDKLAEMGLFTIHEVLVGILFVMAALLWFLRRPGFMKGWPDLITNTATGDATAAMIVVLLLFIIPARYDCTREISLKLITWQYVQKKMHWSLIFLMGGGFAIADGMKASGLGKMVANELNAVTTYPKLVIMVVGCLIGAFVTQFTSNAAVANILLPIVASLARKAKIYPMFLMMPVNLSCSFAFCLPVATPPNAIVAMSCNVKTTEMIKVGLLVEVIALVMLLLIFPNLGSVIWDFNSFPDWAKKD
ncbi:protein I'm not dead yet [Tribolium castaneum]|uniref:Protein I'm not dead yet-like Protein n=1 Tax=Tribolium castaneum TaxID=7070 RepID=D2A4Q3_TRICA|nr:PREDICTED: protein I'm not dead yet [Tribolium castaneum]EFA05193.2 Protein I'm not dead yet-like Protein [Tribolium castaneum]|eukprot:XP_971968.1 PREDICTED: protein I'm not dead yet [Tribolium castaneum]